MPKTLLVPLDGTEGAARAVPVGAQLAERLDADVILVVARLDRDSARTDSWDAVEALGHAHDARVEIVESVALADALRAVADDSNDPAICMATHARGATGHALFGSFAEDVVRALSLPAVLVGPHCGATLPGDRPIAVCLDGSAASTAVVPVAGQWARELAVGVVLVHVFHPLDVETAVHPEAVLGEAAAQLGDLDVEVRLVHGHSAHSVVHIADDLDPSLVALATHGRTGLARVILGSVATSVVRASRCPALVVRPPADVLDGQAS